MQDSVTLRAGTPEKVIERYVGFQRSVPEGSGGISHLTHYPLRTILGVPMKAGYRKVRPDSKGRITLGQLAEGVSSYIVRAEEDGKITLEPLAEVPARERWLYESAEDLARVRRGLEDSKKGRTKSLGSFSRFAK